MNANSCDREVVALLACSALTPAEADRTRQHVQQCRACHEYFLQMSGVCSVHLAAAEELPEPKMSARLYGRVGRAIRAGSQGEWYNLLTLFRARWLRVSGAIAVFLLVGVGRVLLPRPEPLPAHVSQQPVHLAPVNVEPVSTSPSLIAYRLALNRSPEEFDRSLENAAARPSLSATIPLRPGLVWEYLEL